MSKLHYLEACLRETLRLHPTAPVITFQTRPDFEKDSTTIGNGAYQILKGQSIVALLVQMQRDPSVWGSDADEFRPERMMDEHFYKLPKNSWKPFGNGIRGCIGRAFAWQESLLITAMLLQNFDFRLHDPEYKLEIKQTLTIKPGNFYMHASLREHLDPLQLERALHSVGGNATPQTQNPSRGSPSVSSGRSSLTANEEQRSMSILYGSDSGTCESMAQSLAQAATARGYAASVRPLNSAVGKLPSDQPVILISSSYNGQPPSNAVNMVKWLENQQGNTKILQGVRYAVYGCGNKDYAATFHRIPKLLDSEFERLGAQKLAPTGLGDVTVGDVFNDFEKWQDEHLWPALGSSGPLEDYVDHGLAIEIDCSGRRKALQFDADEAVILKNEVLTAPGEPEKRYLTLKLPEGMEYRTGDHLAVLPMNDWSIVHRALKWAGLPWDAVLTIASGANTALPTGRPISAKDLLSGYVELSQPATRKVSGISFVRLCNPGCPCSC
jgi:cytochrome P450/NADPH-cytochrome P450 reductase